MHFRPRVLCVEICLRVSFGWDCVYMVDFVCVGLRGKI